MYDPRPPGRALLVTALLVWGATPCAPAAQQGTNGPRTGHGTLLAADAVYRSVDEHGNVTYSQQPPAEAEEVEAVEVKPGPDQERREAAEARARELQRAAKRLEDAHEDEAAKRRAEVQAAQEALERAQARLEEAQVKREDDWQGLAGGGRRLKPSYHARVRAAKAQVEAARERLNDARR